MDYYVRATVSGGAITYLLKKDGVVVSYQTRESAQFDADRLTAACDHTNFSYCVEEGHELVELADQVKACRRARTQL